MSLHPVVVEDAATLYRIYAAVRAADFQHLGWSEAQLQPLLEMQFAAQQTAYRSYAGAIFLWCAGREKRWEICISNPAQITSM